MFGVIIPHEVIDVHTHIGHAFLVMLLIDFERFEFRELLTKDIREASMYFFINVDEFQVIVFWYPFIQSRMIQLRGLEFDFLLNLVVGLGFGLLSSWHNGIPPKAYEQMIYILNFL